MTVLKGAGASLQYDFVVISVPVRILGKHVSLYYNVYGYAVTVQVIMMHPDEPLTFLMNRPLLHCIILSLRALGHHPEILSVMTLAIRNAIFSRREAHY